MYILYLSKLDFYLTKTKQNSSINYIIFIFQRFQQKLINLISLDKTNISVIVIHNCIYYSIFIDNQNKHFCDN